MTEIYIPALAVEEPEWEGGGRRAGGEGWSAPQREGCDYLGPQCVLAGWAGLIDSQKHYTAGLRTVVVPGQRGSQV